MNSPKSVNLVFFGFVIFISVMLIDFNPFVPEEKIIPNFNYYESVVEKKQQFFDFMRPIVEEENARILKQRNRLMVMYKKYERGEKLTDWDWKWVNKFAEEYRINVEKTEKNEMWRMLRSRIDIIPISLALVQSAKESAWGTSRFALLGNSMFGQWTFSRKDRGIVPLERNKDSIHKIKAFETVRLSVRAYMKNLNTHPAYQALRLIRFKKREAGEELDGYSMALGLINYSQTREFYVAEIREMIRTNKALMEP